MSNNFKEFIKESLICGHNLKITVNYSLPYVLGEVEDTVTGGIKQFFFNNYKEYIEFLNQFKGVLEDVRYLWKSDQGKDYVKG